MDCNIKYNPDQTYKTDYPEFFNVVFCHINWLSNLLKTEFSYKKILFIKGYREKRGVLNQGSVFTKKEQEDFIKTILFLHTVYNKINSKYPNNPLLNHIKIAISNNEFIPSIDISYKLSNLQSNILYTIITSLYKDLLDFIKQTQKIINK